MVNSLLLLALEANGVIALRMMKLMRGVEAGIAKLYFSERYVRLSKLLQALWLELWEMK